MALETDLCGLGVPPEQARLIGQSPQTVAGAGTAQVGAARIYGELITATTAGGQTAFILPTGATGVPYVFVNTSSTAALVFPPVGQFMNGVQNASFSVAQYKPVVFVQFTPNNWFANLSA